MNATTGLTAWIDTRLHSDFGTIVDSGSLIIALAQTSNLVVFKPDEKGYSEVALIKVAESPIYSYPIFWGNHLLIKDKESLSMMEIK